MYAYFNFLILFFIIPSLILSWFQRRELLRYRRTVFCCFLFVFTLGWLWDWLAVRTGVWSYGPSVLEQIRPCGLPVEEFVGFYIFGTLLILNVIFLVLRFTRAGHV